MFVHDWYRSVLLPVICQCLYMQDCRLRPCVAQPTLATVLSFGFDHHFFIFGALW